MNGESTLLYDVSPGLSVSHDQTIDVVFTIGEQKPSVSICIANSRVLDCRVLHSIQDIQRRLLLKRIPTWKGKR